MRSLLLAMFTVFAFAFVLEATVELPDTPAGRLVAEYVRAFNSGDDNAILEFNKTHLAESARNKVTPEQRLQRYHEIYRNLGGYELIRVMNQTENGIQVLARTKSGELVELYFELEPESPHGLLGLRIEHYEGSEEAPPQTRTSEIRKISIPENAAQQMNDYLSRMAAFGFSGSVLVANGDSIIFNKAYGMADRSKNIPNTTETLFDIGSVAKQFTGAAILKLEMMGKLKVTDSISKFLVHVPADKQPITIHQLLTHTSGLAQGPQLIPGFSFEDRDRRIAEILNAPLNSEPGKKFQYNNAGYNVAAAIVEKASGMPFQQFLYENLFKPAGMNSTGFQIDSFPVPGLRDKTIARLYTGEQDNGPPPGEKEFTWFLTGPGGIVTTPGDLFLWHKALSGNQILSEEAKQKLYTPALAGYAYGWGIKSTQYGKLIEHGGGTTMGTGSMFLRYVDAGLVIAFCINNSGEELNPVITRNLQAIVFGDAVNLPPAVVKLEPSQLKQTEGLYELQTGGKINVSSTNDKLLLSAQDSKSIQLLYGTTANERYQKLEERTRSIVEANHRGDFDLLQKNMIGQIPIDRLKAREETQRREWEEKYGALKAFSILGTTPEPQDDAAVNVKLEFERGSVTLQYVWFPDGLDMIRVAAPAIEFLPASQNEFVSYQLSDGGITRAKFIKERMTIARQGEEMNAVRVGLKH